MAAAASRSRSQHRKAKKEMAMAEVDHLAGERATAGFDVEEMKVAWAGSRHAVHVADRMARLVASDPVSRGQSHPTRSGSARSPAYLLQPNSAASPSPDAQIAASFLPKKATTLFHPSVPNGENKATNQTRTDFA